MVFVFFVLPILLSSYLVSSFSLSRPVLQAVAPLTTPLGMSSSAVQEATSTSLSDRLCALERLPNLIVFDLDNTLWTPELYQIRQRNPPTVGKDIRLFRDVPEILQLAQDLSRNRGVDLAIASRTNKQEWAEYLLDNFSVADDNDGEMSLRSLFPYIEIQTGSKKQHMANLRDQSGASYSSMLFYDDDARMNLGETSQMGVLSCHTPRGMTTEYFVKALEKYSDLKAGHDDQHWMGYILNAENLDITEEQVDAGKRCQGRVKFYSPAKRFGFVIDDETGQEFFVHESKVPNGMNLQSGEKVEFQTSEDGRGRPSAAILGDSAGAAGSSTTDDMVEMPCFTMSQPFASLLLNGVKTVESRNNQMFQEVVPGTQVLMHCGRKDWHDQESYLNILEQQGLSSKDIAKASNLPKGFSRGAIIGVVTVGKTWRPSDGERRGKDLQSRVLAPYDGVGKFCTEITDARWLKRPIKTRGNPGVYSTQIPKSVL